jgi:hypothetical protein
LTPPGLKNRPPSAQPEQENTEKDQPHGPWSFPQNQFFFDETVEKEYNKFFN